MATDILPAEIKTGLLTEIQPIQNKKDEHEDIHSTSLLDIFLLLLYMHCVQWVIYMHCVQWVIKFSGQTTHQCVFGSV